MLNVRTPLRTNIRSTPHPGRRDVFCLLCTILSEKRHDRRHGRRPNPRSHACPDTPSHGSPTFVFRRPLPAAQRFDSEPPGTSHPRKTTPGKTRCPMPPAHLPAHNPTGDASATKTMRQTKQKTARRIRRFVGLSTFGQVAFAKRTLSDFTYSINQTRYGRSLLCVGGCPISVRISARSAPHHRPETRSRARC